MFHSVSGCFVQLVVVKLNAPMYRLLITENNGQMQITNTLSQVA